MKVAKRRSACLPFLPFVKLPGLLSLLLLCLAASGLRAADFRTLIERSPFAPAGGPQVNLGEAAPEPGTLEFRGMAVDATGPSYSVFDAAQNRGFWVREGGDGPLRVRSFNAQESVLEVEQNGRPVKLQLKRATLQNGSAPVPRPVAGVLPGGQPAAVGPGNPDGRRLEAVAAEVRRRRALRNAAAAAKPAEPSVQPVAPAQ